MAEAKSNTRVPPNVLIITVHDIAETFSSLMKTLIAKQMARPQPAREIQVVSFRLNEATGLLKVLQQNGEDFEEPLRRALSWMDAASLEKLLIDMEICSTLCFLVRLLSWLYVAGILIGAWIPSTYNAWCNEHVSSATRFALYVSCLEMIDALRGQSQSRPWYIVLLPFLRLGIEWFVAPLVGSVHLSYFVTVGCWALGAMTVDLVVLPLSVMSEMWMLCQAAASHSSALYIAVALWPLILVPAYLEIAQGMEDERKGAGASSTITIHPALSTILKILMPICVSKFLTQDLKRIKQALKKRAMPDHTYIY